MIEREFRMLRILKHENIIEMIDHVYSRNGDTIILERADETLQEYVKHNHMQALEKFDRIFYQMCSAISFTHEKGIVHRDLKPDNFLMVNSNVKLADFSHAITIQNLKENAYIGTVSYLTHLYFVQICNLLKAGNYRTRAPEVLLRLPYDESSDVWSLGFCFAFVILNTRFISGNNDAAVLTEVRTYFPPDEEVPEFQSHPPLFDDSKFKTIMGKVFDKTAMKNGSHFHDLIVVFIYFKFIHHYHDLLLGMLTSQSKEAYQELSTPGSSCL